MNRSTSIAFALAAGMIALLTSCSRTPSVDVFGSFFPVWMFCIAGGIILTAVARTVLVWIRLDEELRPRALVYSSLAALFTCLIWMVGFHE